MTTKASESSTDAPSAPRTDWRRLLGPEGNERLTASIAVVLLGLLALEGYSILRIGRQLSLHVFVGALLIPPIVLKIGSTSWRFVKYYAGSRPYRRRGPPPMALRLLGPVVIGLTVVLFGSGLALIVGPRGWRLDTLFVHKASFVLWLAVMAVHVLGHLRVTAQQSWRDWAGSERDRLVGAGWRRAALMASLACGTVLALWVLPYARTWFGVR